jgi:polar amino acid transport system permease protein
MVFPRFYIPGLIDVKMVEIMTPFVAAVLGLGMNEGSYLTEAVRGGILSVDRGRVEAAHTPGMTPGQTMRRIMLAKTMRLILPVLGNSAIGMLKFTSLAATIAMPEMLNVLRDNDRAFALARAYPAIRASPGLSPADARTVGALSAE